MPRRDVEGLGNDGAPSTAYFAVTETRSRRDSSRIAFWVPSDADGTTSRKWGGEGL